MAFTKSSSVMYLSPDASSLLELRSKLNLDWMERLGSVSVPRRVSFTAALAVSMLSYGSGLSYDFIVSP